MKNLTQRNKIVLAIVVVLVIAVIAVITYSQVSAGQLFGTINTVLMVDPAIPPSPLLIDQQITVSVHNGDTSCRWTVDNPGVVHIVSNHGMLLSSSGVVTYMGNSLAVTGNMTGTVIMHGKCNSGIATKGLAVQAFKINPNDTQIWFGQTKTFSTNANDATCTWTTSDSQRLPIQGSNVGSSVTVKGNWLNSDWGSNIYATLSVNCSGRTTSRRLNIVSN